MWVTESEVENFKAAGHKLAADPKSEKPVMNEPKVDVKKEEEKPTKKFASKGRKG
jgi:hypothetical protein